MWLPLWIVVATFHQMLMLLTTYESHSLYCYKLYYCKETLLSCCLNPIRLQFVQSFCLYILMIFSKFVCSFCKQVIYWNFGSGCISFTSVGITSTSTSGRRSNSFSHFYLCSGNYCRKVCFQRRHSLIVSRAEIRSSDKPATDPRSQQLSLAATMSIFLSLLQENPPILWLPEFQQLPENIQVYTTESISAIVKTGNRCVLLCAL